MFGTNTRLKAYESKNSLLKPKHGFLLRFAKLFLRKSAAVISHVSWLHRSCISPCTLFLTHAWIWCVISQAGRGTIRCQKSGRSVMSRRQQNYVIIVIVESFDNVEISLIFHRIFCGERTRDSYISLAFIVIKRNCKCRIFVWNNSVV